jgi:hypothetical protein
MKGALASLSAAAIALAACGGVNASTSSSEERDGADEPNACGGSALLSFDGGAAAPGDPCGPCRDGALVCASPNLLACVGALPASVCADAATRDATFADGTPEHDASMGADASMGEASVGPSDGGEDAVADVFIEEAQPYDAGPGWGETDASEDVDTLTDGGLPSMQCIDIYTKNLVVDPTRSVLYASVSASSPLFGNTVVRIDPTSVSVTGTVFVGSSPDALAITDDGVSLYVGEDGTASVCRVDTASGGIYDSVYLGPGPNGGVLLASEIAAVPGSATQWVAVTQSTASSGFPGLELYDGTTLLSQWAPLGAEVGSIAFVSPTILFGFDDLDTSFDLYEFSVTSTRLTELNDASGLIQGFYGITAQGGWIFATNGQAVNAATWQPAGQYPAKGAVWPDPNGADVWILQTLTQPPTLFDFDRTTFVAKRSFVLPAEPFTGVTTSLVGWSSTGLAIGTPSSVCIVTVP